MRFLLSAVTVLGIACLTAQNSQAQAPAGGQMPANMSALIDDGQHHDADNAPAMTLDEAERIALAANPEIALAGRRVAMAQAHVPSAGALDDPMAMTRFWGVPLQGPWDLNAAQLMFSVSQTFPGRGKRDLRTDIAGSDVSVAKAQFDQVRLDVRIQVRMAFYDLLRAQDEERIHDGHLAVSRQAIEAARIKYTVGKVPQQDLLKEQVALTRPAEHMIRFSQDLDMARNQLNTLLGRNPATPIAAVGAHREHDPLPDAKRWLTLHSAHGPTCWPRERRQRKAVKRSHSRKRPTRPTSPYRAATC